MNSGKKVKANSELHIKMQELSQEALKITSELNSNFIEENPDILSTVNNNLDEALSSSPKHMKEETPVEFASRVNSNLQKATEKLDSEARHMKEEPTELDIENLPTNVVKLPAEIPDDWDMYLLENVEQGRGRS